MNLIDVLSCTRAASWSDRKSNRQTLETLLGKQYVASLKKAYVLGYAVADLETVVRIRSCIKQKSAWCLRRVFQALPYEEDDLGLTVIGPMCTVYLLIEPNNRKSIAVIGNPSELPASPLLLFFTEAERFPYWLVFGKRLIFE